MSSILFILAVIALLTGSYLIGALLVIGGAFLRVYEKGEQLKYLAQEAEKKRRDEKEEAEEELRQAKEVAEEGQHKFDEFYREKGFPHIFDKVRVAEFARKGHKTLDEAETALCAADALGSLEKGESIAAFERYAKQRSQDRKT